MRDLTEIVCKLYRPDTAGLGERKNSSSTSGRTPNSARSFFPAVDRRLQQRPSSPMEEWSFTYEKVTWKHTKSSTEGEDNWQAA